MKKFSGLIHSVTKASFHLEPGIRGKIYDIYRLPVTIAMKIYHCLLFMHAPIEWGENIVALNNKFAIPAISTG